MTELLEMLYKSLDPNTNRLARADLQDRIVEQARAKLSRAELLTFCNMILDLRIHLKNCKPHAATGSTKSPEHREAIKNGILHSKKTRRAKLAISAGMKRHHNAKRNG